MMGLSKCGILNLLKVCVPNANVNSRSPGYITKTHLFKYIVNFTSKTENFQIKKNLIFFIFLLETEILDGSNEYPLSMF